MPRFLGERIEVEKEHTSPRPVSITWRGQTYAVAEVIEEWVDTGFGATPEMSRTWYNRHHRRYYVVRAATGEVFKLYLDYVNKKKPSWWLVSKTDPGE